MSEVVVVTCGESPAGCAGASPAPTARALAVREAVAAARAHLEPAGLWSVAPVIALDAPLGSAVARTVQDAATEGLTGYAGRPAVLIASGGAETNLDVLLHELTHVWMRSQGAEDARWRMVDGRASHESAVVHEGLADFVAAALTGDPILAEGLGARATPHSLRALAACPGGLTGFAHEDAVIVSGALWELGGAGRTPAAMSEVVSAVRESAVAGGADVGALVDALAAALTARSSPLAARWSEIVEARGLRACHAPIELGAARASARAMDFLAAGAARLGVAEVSGPIHFSAAVAGAQAARVTARSGRPGVLVITWQARGTDGGVVGEGRAPLVGWPSQHAQIALPPASHALRFAFATSERADVTYNDVAVALIGPRPAEPRSAQAVVVEPPRPPAPRSSCAVGGPSDVLLAVLVGWLAWRRRRRRSRA